VTFALTDMLLYLGPGWSVIDQVLQGPAARIDSNSFAQILEVQGSGIMCVSAGPLNRLFWSSQTRTHNSLITGDYGTILEPSWNHLYKYSRTLSHPTDLQHW
jgi:hypothetical protein